MRRPTLHSARRERRTLAGTKAPILLVALEEARRGERIATAAREAGWDVTIWSARRRLGWERAYAVADAFVFDEHRASQIGRRRRPLPSARLRLLMLDSERLAATSALSLGVDAFLFDDPFDAFAERIALAREGYSCMPARTLPSLLADDFRMRQLGQLSEADWRLAQSHLHGASLASTAMELGLPPRQTHAAVRRLLQRLALPTKVGLAALIARARRRPGR